MKVSIRATSDLKSLLETEDLWNSLIDRHSESPTFLSGFIKQYTDSDRSSGWSRLVLLFSVDNKIVGLCPFKIKMKFGIRIAKFLSGLPSDLGFSQDFVIEDQYRDICIPYTVEFLFRSLQCKLVDLTLPAQSKSLQVLEEKCRAIGIRFDTKPQMGHSILQVKSTWEEFEAFRGGNFRRKFKKIERNLGQIGSWRVASYADGNEESSIIRKILDVERRSWKEEWRARSELDVDQELLSAWNGALLTAQTVPSFDWRIWFLELDEKALAYALVFQYKQTAFIVKTSYDKRYQRFYPGIFVINAAIRELFKEKQVNKIDFNTDLPFMKTWTSSSLPRIKFVMSKKSILPALISFVEMDENIGNIRNIIYSSLGSSLKKVGFFADFLG